MFRVVQEFDGSDSEKCVSLQPGDQLSAVHVVDTKWYIGYNERSGETGAFPASCVVNVEGNAGKSRTLDPKYIRVQRSGSLSDVDDHHRFIDISLHKDKSLSLGAIHFDEDRLEATKERRNVRLESANMHSSLEASVPHSSITTSDFLNDAIANRISNPDPKDDSESNVINNTPDKETAEDTDGPKLLHSLSVPDSVVDWNESSFEDSFQQTTSEREEDAVIKRSEEFSVSELPVEVNNEDSNTKRGKNTECTTRALVLASSAFCGLLVIAMIFVTFVYVFKIPVLAAGVLVAVISVSIIVLFILTSAMRCVLLLLFPSMVSDVGLNFLYVLLLCLILNGPIMHLSNNIHLTGNSISCAIDRVAHQQIALGRKSTELENDIIAHVEKQKSLLLAINSNISKDFDTIESNISVIDDHLAMLIGNMTSVYENCSKPLDDGIHTCYTAYCNLFPDQYGKLTCETECRKLEGMKRLCKVLDIGGNIAEASTKSKVIMDRARDNLRIGMSVRKVENITGHSLSGVELAVDMKINTLESVFGDIMWAAEILMSLSLIIIFVWTFIVYRRFLSDNAYNNVYVNGQLREYDVLNARKTGGETALPIRHVEKEDYIGIMSMKLPKRYYYIIVWDLLTLLGHVFLVTMLVLINCGLWYIIYTIKSNVQKKKPYSAPETFNIKVFGIGPVAYFYKNLFNGVNIYDDFIRGTKTSLQRCMHETTNTLDTYSILGFGLLYAILIIVIVLHGYGPRLQAAIFSIYYPNVAQERAEYLRARIICNRHNQAPFAAQVAKSRHREIIMKQKFSIRTKLRNYLPCLKNIIKEDFVRCCICCGTSEGDLSKMSVCYCTLHLSAMSTNFCNECKDVFEEQCPICT